MSSFQRMVQKFYFCFFLFAQPVEKNDELRRFLFVYQIGNKPCRVKIHKIIEICHWISVRIGIIIFTTMKTTIDVVHHISKFFMVTWFRWSCQMETENKNAG